MTKISCEECRARLGEVLAWEVAQGGAEAPDLAALRAHLDDCPACARDLEILRGARLALREFSVVPAPGDLRARIRSQLEREPQASTRSGMETLSTLAAVEVLPASSHLQNSEKQNSLSRNSLSQNSMPVDPFAATHLAAMRHAPNRRDVRDGWDRVLKFFSRPANVAATSGLALAAFCLVLFIQPGRREILSETSDTALSQRAPSADRSTLAAAPAAKAAASHAPSSVKPGAAKPTGKNGAPLPTTSLPSNWPVLPPLNPPPNFSDGTARTALPPANIGTTQNGAAQPPQPAQKFARALSPAPIRTNAAPSTQATNAPSATPRDENEEGAAQRRNVNSAGATKPPGSAASAGAMSDAAPSTPAASEASRGGGAFAGNGLSAGAPRAAMKSAGAGRSFSMRADRNANSLNGDLRDKDSASSTPMTRFVSSHITPPRDIGWGQVSVILEGGARFSDGGKSRVIWQGAASSGEPIDIMFSVAAPRGNYSARLVLQEVKHGDAQTVASKSVDVTLH